MQLKNILALGALALVGVNADARTDAHRGCNSQSGFFIEARDDPSDTRYGCLVARFYSGDTSKKYCGSYDDNDLCYIPEYGNMNYCDKTSPEFHSRGCALSISALWYSMKSDDKKYEETKKACPKKGGFFLENPHDLTDHRFACLTPFNGDYANKYCVTYDDNHICYEPELSNMSYCNKKDKNYHSRGCALGLSYLWNIKTSDDKLREKSRALCVKKSGYYCEPKDKTDIKFACLQDRAKAEYKNYCVSYDGISVCYNEELSNVDACKKGHPDFHSRGCAYILQDLWRYRRR